MTAVFLEGHALDVLRGMPADFFHCAVTSPPYFGLRRYKGGEETWDGDPNCQHEWVEKVKKDTRGVEGTGLHGRDPYKGGEARVDRVAGICSKCGAWCGQLGAEPTPDLYISHLIQIFREVKRVLRPDGVFWVNIGDSWATHASGGKEYAHNFHAPEVAIREGIDQPKPTASSMGCKELDMVLIPSLLALALRADGWYMRSMVVWDKKNPMPESVNGWRWEKHKVKVAKSARAEAGSYHSSAYGDSPMGARDGRDFADHSKEWQDCPGCPKCLPNDGYILRKGSWRPTDSYEVILMLTKTDSYFCDREAVLEQGVYPSGESRQGGDGHKSLRAGSRTTEGLHNKAWVGNGGRNLRSVWSFPTKPGKFNHYAAYPPRLPEICIKASTSEKGCCPECGAPWARVIEKPPCPHTGYTEDKNLDPDANGRRIALMRQAAREQGHEYVGACAVTIAWRPTCSCNAGVPISCRVLDPFSGAGTTALAAERLGVDSISIDTSAEYIQLSRDRLAADEQRRVEEFIQQARRAARGGNGHKSASELETTAPLPSSAKEVSQQTGK